MGKRDLEGADRLVSKALEIIQYFSSANWAFENPQSGLLKTRKIVEGLPYHDTTYCKYPDFLYKKPTRIWTNLALSLHEPCTLRNPCSSMIGRRHPMTAQQSRRGCDKNDTNNTCSQRELYRIPDALCDEIAATANRALLETDDGTAQPTPRADVPAPETFISEEL